MSSPNATAGSVWPCLSPYPAAAGGKIFKIETRIQDFLIPADLDVRGNDIIFSVRYKATTVALEKTTPTHAHSMSSFNLDH